MDGFQRQAQCGGKKDKRPWRTRWLRRTWNRDPWTLRSTGPQQRGAGDALLPRPEQAHPALGHQAFSHVPNKQVSMKRTQKAFSKAVTEAELPDEQMAAASKKQSGKCRIAPRQPQLPPAPPHAAAPGDLVPEPTVTLPTRGDSE